VPEPEIAEDVSMSQLSKEARARLRGLTKENAERVGLHLVMAGRLLDVDPERAYEHAQAAVRRGGRIDVVREAAGLAAYRTGRYAEALRELRTVRRLNGSSEHLPLMADAERGLGRPERAIALAASEEAQTLDATGRTELAIVVSGARSDLGEHDAAIAVLDKIPAAERKGDLGLRVLQAKAVALETAGRTEEAAALLADVDPAELERAAGVTEDEDEVVVYDVYDEEADEDVPADEDAAAGERTVVDDEVLVDEEMADEPESSDEDEAEDGDEGEERE
jgi:tetratricopeptide (TPR) repeat protein